MTSGHIIRCMNFEIIVHEAEEGFWAEVPAIPGCATQGGTFEDLISNLKEAIEGCLSADMTPTYVLDIESRLME